LTSSHRRRAIALAASLFAIAAPAANAACDEATSKPFARWLDPFSYVLAPGGDFEGSSQWSLTGASIVSGNEPWGTGSHALSVPRGASATSPAFCGGIDHPTVRLFSKGGGLLGLLNVTVNYTDANGVLRSQPLGVVTGSGSWQPSLPMVTLSGIPLVTSSTMTVTLTAVSGSFTVDDVYVDPWGNR
jgi:hypothetical protein